MEKTKIKLAEPQTLATQLHAAEASLAFLESQVKELRESLLDNLKSQGVRRVDLENGDSYIIAHRDNLVIKDKMAALKWGRENPEARMKLDTSAALEVARMVKLKWAKIEGKEYLKITRNKEQDILT